jgi:hypothetical protein
MLTLTPQARAIAALALAFLLISGELYRIGNSIVAMFNNSFGQGQFAAASAISVVVGAGVLWFANRAAAGATETWTVAIAQSARLLAVIGLAMAALSLASGLLQDGSGNGFYLGLS